MKIIIMTQPGETRILGVFFPLGVFEGGQCIPQALKDMLSDGNIAIAGYTCDIWTLMDKYDFAYA